MSSSVNPKYRYGFLSLAFLINTDLNSCFIFLSTHDKMKIAGFLGLNAN